MIARQRKWLVPALATLVAGCGAQRAERPAPCLQVPPPAQIEIVKVTEVHADGTTGAGHQVDTRPRVEALVAALQAATEAAPAAECRTVETARKQELSVGLEGRDSVPLILWIGPDWIGGVDTLKDAKGKLLARWRPLAPGEHDLLVHLLRVEGAP